MKVAVEGCCHGHLDEIYGQIQKLEQKNDYKVDLLLICGDFQAIRNWQDLQCMAVPEKYKALGQFYKYYTGEETAPILTIVIGGNHEASNYMWELFHGGWLAPNIYYLGTAGCVQVNGLRIAGASGIFKVQDFRLGFYEKLPYDRSSMRSIYHVRESTIRRLSLLSSPHVFMSHDWPNTIERYGDTQDLLRKKTFFREEVRAGNLGSPPMMGLLQNLKPDWWFSAHLHVRFEALVVHEGATPRSMDFDNPDEIKIDEDEELEALSKNPDEIALFVDDDTIEPPPPPPGPRRETRFLALDKCQGNKQYLEVVDIALPAETEEKPSLSFDPEWLAITRAFHPWMSTVRHQPPFPKEDEAKALVAENISWVEKNIPKDASGKILVETHQNFIMTAPGPGSEGQAKFQQPALFPNPQTESFCRMLEIENKISPAT